MRRLQVSPGRQNTQTSFLERVINNGTEMNIKQLAGLVLFGFIMVWGCKKLYSPHASSTSNSFLVIEGVIAAGNDSTIIDLSRTIQLTDTIKHKPELGAKVTVDDSQGATYSLTELDSGRYAAPSLNLDNSHKFRLFFFSFVGLVFFSVFVPV